jgi:serine/threonine protein kinase
MSAEARRVTKTEVWVGWESQVVNGVYPLRRFLGGSNHSAVFLTEYAAENLPNAAIKLVPAGTMDTEAQLVQWGAAATLSHPNLLRLLDVGRCQLSGRGYLFVVMEYAEQTLAQILPRRALSSDEVTQLLIPTLDVLAALHYNNLVHSQLKPSNFLVVDDQLKLASDTIRSTGYYASGIIRTSPYDPPELSDGDISATGDVWGLGITLAEALTQHAPAWQDERFETAALSAALPPEFADTVRRCLSRIPSSRPTVADLKAQYNPPRQAHAISVSEYEPAVSEAPPEPEQPQPARKSSNSGMLGLGVAAAIVILAGVWVSWPTYHGHSKPARSTGGISRARLHSGSAVRAPSPGAAGDAATATATATDMPIRTAPIDTAVTPADTPIRTAPIDTAVTPAGTPIRTAPIDTAVTPAGTPVRTARIDATVTPAGRRVGTAADAAAIMPAGAPVDTAGNSTAVTSSDRRVGTSADPSRGGTTGRAASAYAGTPASEPYSASAGTPATPLAPNSVLHQEIPDVSRVILGKIRGHVNVAVRVLVDPSGNVVGEFFENPGPSRYFARLAGDAAGAWTFAPTDQRGSRVWLLRFEFTRDGATVRAVAPQ